MSLTRSPEDIEKDIANIEHALLTANIIQAEQKGPNFVQSFSDRLKCVKRDLNTLSAEGENLKGALEHAQIAANENKFNWELIKSETEKEAAEEEIRYREEEANSGKAKELGSVVKASADHAYKELSSVVLERKSTLTQPESLFFTKYIQEWLAENKTNNADIFVGFIKEEQQTLSGSTCRIQICIRKALVADLELEYERGSDTLMIHQYDIKSTKEEKQSWQDSQYLVFQKMNLLATTAFEDMLVFFAREALHNILNWFASYHDLFMLPCQRCHKLLQFDSPQYRYLPPMVRIWAKKQPIQQNEDAPMVQSTGVPYHMRCYIEYRNNHAIPIMPHKRAKASVRKARQQEKDMPVAKDDATSEDTPKGFSRLLRFKEMAIKRQVEKKEAKKNVEALANKKNIHIQPGERMKDFVQRVESEFQSEMITVQKKSKPVSDRKKRNQETRKQKKVAKLQKELDLYGGRDFDDLKDNVKFGEVADAPPVLNKIPKARGRGKEVNRARRNMLEQKNKKAIASSTTKAPNTEEKKETGYESEEDENMKALKASHKRKIQNMSAAARIQLDNEREKVIEAYRAKKAKRMNDSGFNYMRFCSLALIIAVVLASVHAAPAVNVPSNMAVDPKEFEASQVTAWNLRKIFRLSIGSRKIKVLCGKSIGKTSEVQDAADRFATTPEEALEDERFSKAAYPLEAGAHKITIKVSDIINENDDDDDEDDEDDDDQHGGKDKDDKDNDDEKDEDCEDDKHGGKGKGKGGKRKPIWIVHTVTANEPPAAIVAMS
ncbi:hypothetical protein MAM1_0155d06774 [Mucor ambiguus]|uniref:Uncharacterized protein n=1 Tax=Mucor ambiguus TaxID=91626 RepID=A0A0C9MYJ5_9FUNG|nr:hypothetical protein MAM1_0155d06774 [Mucor ambiguus]